MRKSLFGVCLSLLSLSFVCQAQQLRLHIVNPNDVVKQEPIDDVVFTVQYEENFVVDISKPERIETETMLLKVGQKSTAYYSYTKYLSDSTMRADIAAGADMEVVRQNAIKYNAKIRTSLYKNFPTGKVTTLDQLAGSKLRCEEDNERPEWTVHEDTLTVTTYLCTKATCHFKGRDYVAWFTPEIARSEGPWKLHGLPGLILKAEDSEGHYSFICTGIEQTRDKEEIMFGADGYQSVSRKDMARLYERFMADPTAYVRASSPNVRLHIRTPDGQEGSGPKNLPYNPIER